MDTNGSSENRFWQFSGSHWIEQLQGTANGLTSAKAASLAHVTDQHQPQQGFVKDLLLFISQFKSPLMLMLLGAISISAFLGDTSDVFIILFIVLSTGCLSFFQERHAGKVVQKLQALISIRSTVLRNGQPQLLEASRVLPGDILLLKAGDILPADCLLIESTELYANEASLSGESYPARKDPGILPPDTVLAKRTNCLWEGTSIISGEARALVIETGKQTLFGKLKLSAAKSVETSFEKGIREFGFFLMKITMLLAFFILLVNIFNHTGIMESAMFSLALAVGMAPELLPAITTISMSMGAKRLLDKKVIVKKLSSIQNLGEVNVLCTDKTGTITEGLIQIAGLVDHSGSESSFVGQLAYWNAAFETGYSNPIDEALRKTGAPDMSVATKLGEIPYDFNRKRLSIAVEHEGEKLLISKGAFGSITGICSGLRLSNGQTVQIGEQLNALGKQFSAYGEQGLRAIAVCYKHMDTGTISKEMETDMIFAGFILMHDPVKKDIAQAIEKLSALNISLKIITGDNPAVAGAVARQIGIAEPVVVSGRQLDKTSPEALTSIAASANVFAEVEPQQKERIILALKKLYTVAYMGDGINDVAAINAADAGISVSNAVDVAREAADFVLTENDLSVLANGIKEGRKTFANTMKYIYINTGSTFGNMFSVAVASLMLPFLPMLPKQILLTNFLTDFPFLAVSGDNVDEEQLQKPGKWNIKHVRNYMLVFGIHSSLFDLISFCTLYFLLKLKESPFQTGWFIESILTELFILFVIRTRRTFLKSKPGKYLFITSMLALLVTVLLPYLPATTELGFYPLPIKYLAVILGIVAMYVFTADLLKAWFFKKYQPAGQ